MNLILQNTEKIEMSMSEFIAFTRTLVSEIKSETYGDYMTREQAIKILGGRRNLEKAIKMGWVNKGTKQGNSKMGTFNERSN